MISMKEYILNEFLVNNHTTNNIDKDFVDLDLTSGTLWCTHNLGATNPYDFGKYYMFGQTEVPKHNNCCWEKSPLNNRNREFDADEFNDMKYVYIDEKQNLNDEYDAAYKESNGDWRIPTRKEASELMLETNMNVVVYNNNTVIELSSKKNPDNKIYIPYSGYQTGSTKISSYTALWTSSLYNNDNKRAWCMGFTKNRCTFDLFQLCNGLQIRPVKNM